MEFAFLTRHLHEVVAGHCDARNLRSMGFDREMQRTRGLVLPLHTSGLLRGEMRVPGVDDNDDDDDHIDINDIDNIDYTDNIDNNNHINNHNKNHNNNHNNNLNNIIIIRLIITIIITIIIKLKIIT